MELPRSPTRAREVYEISKSDRFLVISADFCTRETNIVCGAYTELGGAFGPIQAISDFIYLISKQTYVRDFICIRPLGNC